MSIISTKTRTFKFTETLVEHELQSCPLVDGEVAPEGWKPQRIINGINYKRPPLSRIGLLTLQSEDGWSEQTLVAIAVDEDDTHWDVRADSASMSVYREYMKHLATSGNQS